MMGMYNLSNNKNASTIRYAIRNPLTALAKPKQCPKAGVY